MIYVFMCAGIFSLDIPFCVTMNLFGKRTRETTTIKKVVYQTRCFGPNRDIIGPGLMNNVTENNVFFTVCYTRASTGFHYVEYNTMCGPVGLVVDGGVSSDGGVSLGHL
jgi:hypothetical protein